MNSLNVDVMSARKGAVVSFKRRVKRPCYLEVTDDGTEKMS